MSLHCMYLGCVFTLCSLFFFADVWGFDEDAVKVLENMRPADENLIYKYAILLGEKALRPIIETEV